jgi:hypothetical protein
MSRWELPPMRMTYSGFKQSTSLAHPIGLRPSVIPLTIVCGPPASGKTTYVKDHAAPADLVIDLDDIGSRLSGGSLHDWSRNFLVAALDERNRYLRALSKPCSWPAAWFIVGAPKLKERQWWKEKLQPKTIVVLVPPPELCHQRIRARGVRIMQQSQAVEDWFCRYGGFV